MGWNKREPIYQFTETEIKRIIYLLEAMTELKDIKYLTPYIELIKRELLEQQTYDEND